MTGFGAGPGSTVGLTSPEKVGLGGTGLGGAGRGGGGRGGRLFAGEGTGDVLGMAMGMELGTSLGMALAFKPPTPKLFSINLLS